MGNITFTMIKPEAVAANNIGGILKMIEKGGFRIVAMRKVLLARDRAGAFYAVHGSDSDENAKIEADFHFSAEERH